MKELVNLNYMKSNKDFFLGVLLVTLHRWRLTYAYTNNTPVNLYWILYIIRELDIIQCFSK
ncbi:hypothetical protein SCACP_12510 [Sporomusa carbonis]